MTTYVVDASVAVKWYVPEMHSAEAAKLLDTANDLHVPDLVYAEFGNVLWKKVSRGELTRDEAADVLAEFLAVPLITHESVAVLSHALGIAFDYGRTVYDSLYLATANLLGCQAVIADDRLHNALQGTPIAPLVLHVRDL